MVSQQLVVQSRKSKKKLLTKQALKLATKAFVIKLTVRGWIALSNSRCRKYTDPCKEKKGKIKKKK